MAPEVPHVASVKALVCPPTPTRAQLPPFPPFCSLLLVKYAYKHTILPPAESDGAGEFSSEDEGDIQVSLMGDSH